MKALPGALTERQAEVLQAIKDLTTEFGYPPTVRELGDKMGIRSTNGVACHLDYLQRKGAITRDPNRARSTLVVPEDGDL